jgi:hypothetical protein
MVPDSVPKPYLSTTLHNFVIRSTINVPYMPLCERHAYAYARPYGSTDKCPDGHINENAHPNPEVYHLYPNPGIRKCAYAHKVYISRNYLAPEENRSGD